MRYGLKTTWRGVEYSVLADWSRQHASVEGAAPGARVRDYHGRQSRALMEALTRAAVNRGLDPKDYRIEQQLKEAVRTATYVQEEETVLPATPERPQEQEV